MPLIVRGMDRVQAEVEPLLQDKHAAAAAGVARAVPLRPRPAPDGPGSRG